MDIENNLASIKYIEQAKVIAQRRDGQIIKIVGFVKIKKNCTKLVSDIKNDLAQLIPGYMIPSIKIVNSFKLNNNGKIDVNFLNGEVDGR